MMGMNVGIVCDWYGMRVSKLSVLSLFYQIEVLEYRVLKSAALFLSLFSWRDPGIKSPGRRGSNCCGSLDYGDFEVE